MLEARILGLLKIISYTPRSWNHLYSSAAWLLFEYFSYAGELTIFKGQQAIISFKYLWNMFPLAGTRTAGNKNIGPILRSL